MSNSGKENETLLNKTKEATVDSPVYTLTDLSIYLKMPKQTLYNWISQGRVPKAAILRVGRRLRFRKKAIAQWIENSQIGEID